MDMSKEVNMNEYKDINTDAYKEIFIADKIYRKIQEENGIKHRSQVSLYHGSPKASFTPMYGFGEDKHDYGRGFYLTLDFELACEWAVCTSETNGYVHKYILDTTNLSILDFNKTYDILTWLATLAKHRSASPSKRYKRNEDLLISKYYKPEIENYDVIIGYRADDSFFSYAKQAIRGEIDISLLDEIMREGNLGYQVFVQSEKAFKSLVEIEMNNYGFYKEVDYAEYRKKYDERDRKAREVVPSIINSDRNTLTDTIEKYILEGR